MSKHLILAEWQKIMGHRWMTGFTVWIFPVGAVGVFATFIFLLFLMPDTKERLLNAPLVWDAQFLGPWVMFSSAGGGMFVRILPIVFCATVFAGEFGWGTWKNIVPRSNRHGLIVGKYVVVILMLTISLLLTSLIAGFATFGLSAISGQPLIPILTSETALAFIGDYVMGIVIGFIVIVFITNYAALSSIITKSTVGGAILGIGLMIFEEFLLPVLNLLSRLLNTPDLVQVYRLTPSYNLKNASHWIRLGEPSTNQFYVELTQPDTLLFSVSILIGWSVLMAMFVVVLFERQDIVT